MKLSSNTWNPTESSGLALWLAYNTGISTVLGKVTQWSNYLTGSSDRFIQLTETNQPLFSDETDTKYGVDFDGADNYLIGPQYTLSGAFTIGLKFTVQDANASNDVITGDLTTLNNWIRLNDGDTLGIKTTGGQKTINLDSTVFDQNDTAHLVVSRNDADRIEIWVNGAKQTNSATSEGEFLVDGLGARNSGSNLTNYFARVIYEVVLYDGAQSDELSEQVCNHLQSIKIG